MQVRPMSLRSFLLIAVIASTSIPIGRVFAQFDPHCYYPTVGKQGEIDTIYGSHDQQHLTSYLNIGPAPGEKDGRILMSGLPENPPFLTAVKTGSAFDLHHLSITQKTDLNVIVFPVGAHLPGGSYQLGHFHSPKYTDILRWDRQYGPIRIYWSDERGNYDSAHFTDLVSRTGHPGVVPQAQSMRAYTAHMSQDSVDDVILGFLTSIDQGATLLDSDFLYRGGKNLYDVGTTAYPDSEIAARESPQVGHMRAWRATSQGDWRGVGRDDLIGGDEFGNLFHFSNDPPFSLSRVRDAMLYDSLWLQRENPIVPLDGTRGTTWAYLLPMPSHRALPKALSDRSEDFIVSLPTNDARNESYFFFRGGKDFGSHRITLDSALPNPQPGTYWGYSTNFFDGMTSSGDPVMLVTGQTMDGFVSYYYFFVLGNSFDKNVDMFYSMGNTGSASPGTIDSIDADGDGLSDVSIGMPGLVTAADNDKGWSNVGSIQIIHGSRKIPVKRSGVAEKVLPASSIDVFPNPLHSEATISLLLNRPSTVEITLHDVLGRVVYNLRHPFESGYQKLPVNFGAYASGSYRLQVNTGEKILTNEVLIVK